MSESSIPDELVFHGNGGSFPPHGIITASDHGPAVVVATWIMVCLMGLAVLARFGSRRAIDGNSVAICFACVLAIAQSVIVHLAVNHGLGRHMKNLNLRTYADYSKTRYASQILRFPVYYLAKLSLIFVFLRLTPSTPARRYLWAFMIVLTAWATIAIIVYGVQCPLPRPWDLLSAGCLNMEALYLTNGLINIFSDFTIILIPFMILWDVQITRSRKWAVWSIFMTRIVVCIASGLELAGLHIYFNEADKSWFDVDPTIWGQVSMNLSIITACIPLMKPLFDMLQFSLIDSAIPVSIGMVKLRSKGQRDWTLGKTTGS